MSRRDRIVAPKGPYTLSLRLSPTVLGIAQSQIKDIPWSGMASHLRSVAAELNAIASEIDGGQA